MSLGYAGARHKRRRCRGSGRALVPYSTTLGHARRVMAAPRFGVTPGEVTQDLGQASSGFFPWLAAFAASGLAARSSQGSADVSSVPRASMHTLDAA